MDLFDSPWKLAIIAVLIIVMFGAKRLPGAAKSLGQSMRILKSEVSKMHDDDEPVASNASTSPATSFPAAELTSAPVAPAASVSADHQAQIDALQQQIRDMQRSAAMDPVPSSKQDVPVNQQS
jgi:sec-independent protein translocase protein TatA